MVLSTLALKLCILLVDNICGFRAVLTMNNDYFSRLE
jgi:hypothetical protein